MSISMKNLILFIILATFEACPEYHATLHPKTLNCWEQISTRDNILEKHPNLQFISTRISSLE
jgi:hypothetical protein